MKPLGVRYWTGSAIYAIERYRLIVSYNSKDGSLFCNDSINVIVRCNNKYIYIYIYIYIYYSKDMDRKCFRFFK